MVIELPPKVKYIIRRLTEHGFEAYAVGGCIRDSILKKSPQDWDITTSANPAQVKGLFAHTVDTGIQHGTVTVMLEREGFEVTTYRIDGEYEDARHPKEVQFTGDLLEDLKRRDFTVNAMAYNETKGLVDAFCGISDLKRGIIRCVGDATERFNEDALRMLRAVRFAAQLDFEIEEDTERAIRQLAGNIAKVSVERISAELVKLLVSGHPEKITEAYRAGLTGVFLPEFDRIMETEQNHPHHCHTVGMHTVESMRNVPPEKTLRLAMLFHDMAKPACKTTDEAGIDHFKRHPEAGERMAQEILRRLKFDNDTIKRVCSLVRYHDDNPPAEERAVRRAINRIGPELYPDLFLVKRADILAQSSYKREEKLAYVEEYEHIYRQILEKNQCLSIGDLAIGGDDLIGLGMQPGREIGETLRRLLDIVLEDPAQNTRENLIKQVIK